MRDVFRLGTALFIALLMAVGMRAAETQFPFSDALLFERGEMTTYAGEHLAAVSFPLGGVGTGAVHLDGRGVRHGWMIFPRYWSATVPPDKPALTTSYYVSANKRVPQAEPKTLPYYMSYVPDSFIAVRAAPAMGPTVTRVLQTVPEGAFPACEAVTLQAAYPFAWYRFQDEQLPVAVSMRAWNPLIPGDLRSSGMPAAVFDVTVYNPGKQKVQVSVLSTQQNAIGYDGGSRTIAGVNSGAMGGNLNRLETVGPDRLLHCLSNRVQDAMTYGDMVLACRGGADSGTADWRDNAALFADFADDGAVKGAETTEPTAKGTVNGALTRTFQLAPDERRTITFVLTWSFPNAYHAGDGKTNESLGKWQGEGNYYTNWWPDAKASAAELLQRYDELERRTAAYQQALYETNLPNWLMERISSQVTPIRTRTVWWARNGYFGAWEGMSAGSGSCPGNCSHVWHYAQTYARLFPELGRRMREQEMAFPLKDGGLPFRQSSDAAGAAENRVCPAVDGQLGTVLGCYREYLCSTDAVWLQANWPKVRQAMAFVMQSWDADGDGVLSGIQHTTLDCKIGGSNSWLGSMYLAALRACEQMSIDLGDAAAEEQYRQRHLSGSKLQGKTLFDGDYFIQDITGEVDKQIDYYTDNGFRHPKEMHPAFIGGRNYYNGCLSEQLLGQWWAQQVNLGWLYPKQDVQTALRSLLAHNYFPTFKDFSRARVPWIDPEDGGLVALTFPKGTDPRLKGKKVLGYDACTLTGFEYAAAGAMLQAGLQREAFTLMRTVADRYDGRMRTGLHKSAWGYSGNPFGDDESGKFYARSQSSWSLLLAAQGFHYHGPKAELGFAPVWQPENHISFFTVAEGFGVYRQTIAGGRLTVSLSLRDGHATIRRLLLAPVPGDGAFLAKVDGRIVAVERVSAERVALVLPAARELQAGEQLTAELVRQ